MSLRDLMNVKKEKAQEALNTLDEMSAFLNMPDASQQGPSHSWRRQCVRTLQAVVDQMDEVDEPTDGEGG